MTNHLKYRWTLLYARDRDSKNMLEYNEFAYKKTKDFCKLEDRFQKNAIAQLHIQYAKSQIKTLHITRAVFILIILLFRLTRLTCTVLDLEP